MFFVIRIVNIFVSLLTFLVFVYSLLTFFLSPYQPLLLTLAKIIEPMLAPIRQVLPPTGGVDLSPLVLIILIQILGSVLVALLRSFS